MDDGSAYEIGFAHALNKVTYGYIRKRDFLAQRTVETYPCALNEKGQQIDRDGYLVLGDFGESINIMMECGIIESGGRLVEGDFEACLVAIRDDIDSGRLLPKRIFN